MISFLVYHGASHERARRKSGHVDLEQVFRATVYYNSKIQSTVSTSLTEDEFVVAVCGAKDENIHLLHPIEAWIIKKGTYKIIM